MSWRKRIIGDFNRDRREQERTKRVSGSSSVIERPATSTVFASEPKGSSSFYEAGEPPRYIVESKWCGYWGGWGSESDIAAVVNQRAAHGYRLVSTKNLTAWWWNPLWIMPLRRPKVLFIFERE